MVTLGLLMLGRVDAAGHWRRAASPAERESDHRLAVVSTYPPRRCGLASYASYRAAAVTVMRACVDSVLVQHEFGIFGGADGRYVLSLTRELAAHHVPYLVRCIRCRSGRAPARQRRPWPRWPPRSHCSPVAM
jgi:hypothetical protein